MTPACLGVNKRHDVARRSVVITREYRYGRERIEREREGGENHIIRIPYLRAW